MNKNKYAHAALNNLTGIRLSIDRLVRMNRKAPNSDMDDIIVKMNRCCDGLLANIKLMVGKKEES